MPSIDRRVSALLVLAVLAGGTGCPHRLPDKLACESGVDDKVPPIQRAEEVSPDVLYPGGFERYAVVIDTDPKGATSRAYVVDTKDWEATAIIEGEPSAVSRALGVTLPPTAGGRGLHYLIPAIDHGVVVPSGGFPPIKGGERNLITRVKALQQLTHTPTTCKAQ